MCRCLPPRFAKGLPPRRTQLPSPPRQGRLAGGLAVSLLALCHGMPAAAEPAPPAALLLNSQIRLAQPLAASTAPGTRPAQWSGAPLDDDPELATWRRARRSLRVGVVGNYLPPFDLIDLEGEYRGISADYLAVLAARLRMPLSIQRYPSQQAARRALDEGAIDLATTTLDGHADGLRTAPYRAHRLVELVSRRDSEHNEAVRTIGYLRGEVSPDALQLAYPDAPLQPFGNLLGALDELVRKADFVMVTSATAASYLIDQYNYDELTARNFAPIAPDGVRFAVADPALGRIVDRALAGLPATLQRQIDNAWVPVALDFNIADKLNLSTAERAWLAGHPDVRYLASRDLMPFQFIDAGQRLEGLTEQVLHLVGQRTGLRFVPYWPASAAAASADIDTGTLDVVPVLPLNHPATGLGALTVSAPYYSGNWVVVTHVGNDSTHSLPDLAGKVIAGPPFNGIQELVGASYPVRRHETGTYEEAFRMVAEGKADATIASAFMADYMLKRAYAGRLRIATATGGMPLEVGLGVTSKHPELLAILNKALLSISHEDLGAMRAHWTQARTPVLAWRQLLPWLMAGAALPLAVSGLSLAWVTSLRRQVTQRTAAEHALLDQLAFQATVLDGIPQPIFLRDNALRMITCNSAYENALGAKREALRGTAPGFARSTVPSDIGHEECRDIYRHVLKTGLPFGADRRLVINGEMRSVISWAVQLRRADGRTAGIVGGWIDVTEREQMLAELAAAKDRAEAANRAKSTFLASISHEIRTPMNAILGMLELTLTRRRGTRDREQLGTAHGAATSLLSLLDDILDLSKLEAGQFTLQLRAACLRKGLHEVVRMFRPVAAQKGLTLELRVDDAVAPAHLVDMLRIRQIIGNFVSNAIRFTERGGVEVRLHGNAARDGRQALEIVIEDSGIGIPVEAIGKLFRPFVQVESAGRPNTGGTGLGLSISHSLVRKMGGEVTLESAPGQGTRVVVRLDLEVSAAAPAQSKPPGQRTGFAPFPPACRVLVVDDHAPNRLLLVRQLERLGIASCTAEDGALGLQAILRAPPDLVICDCMMPVMDGYGLASAIRARQDAVSRIPIIGCTASGQSEDHQRALAAGMNGVMVKPVGLATLERTLRGYLGATAQGTVAPHEDLAEASGEEQPRRN
ncbi:transporter substrate-binding domain-containing protein [Cupriavidus sp. 2TAF22]|uniref:ATP-binding protein n=1 Tax=unclassified Cupriavidus TaxID=2640874 RepID=UPI003F92E958